MRTGTSATGVGHDDASPSGTSCSEARRYTFELDRRDFCRLFGGGLVVLVARGRCPTRRNPAAPRPQGRGDAARARRLAAHRRGRRACTVYTGKVEIGQNIRTSLAQAVAEELRVPIASIAHGDGRHRPTPVRRGHVRQRRRRRAWRRSCARAAATAREVLIDLAAARRGRSIARTLTARDGKVVARRTAASLAYGELTKGQKLTGTIPADAGRRRRPTQWTSAARRSRRSNGRDFVTGRHQYTPDMRRPGMLLRASPPARRLSAARSCQRGRAKARGDGRASRSSATATSSASSRRPSARASRAAAAIQAEWNVPPGQPSSETIFEHLKKNRERAGGRGGGRRTARRCRGWRVGRAHVRGRRTRIAVHRARAARAARRGRRVGGRQADRLDRHAAAVRRARPSWPRRSGIPEDRVRVIVPDTGSGYGGKHTGEAAIEAARLAKAAGKPVKLVWTREEEFTWAYFRPAGVIEVKSGVDADGTHRRLGVPQLQLRRLRHPDAVRQSREARHVVPRVEVAAAAGLVPRARRDREPLRPRDAHGRARARARHRRRRVPAEEPEGRAPAGRARRGGEEVRLAEAVRRRAARSASRAAPRRASYVATAAEVSKTAGGRSRSCASSPRSSAARS